MGKISAKFLLFFPEIRKMPRTAGCGRKRTNEWSEVTKVEGSNKVICKHCSTEISAKIERIITHLNKCTKRLKTSKGQSLKLTGTGSEQSDDDSLMPSTQSDVDTDASQPSTSSASASLSISSGVRTEQQKDSSKSLVGVQRLQRKVSDYAIITTESQKKALDKAVARFFLCKQYLLSNC